MVKTTLTLNSGFEIPTIGLGTWNLRGRATDPVRYALDIGYRHIDTAKIYGTEEEIGDAVRLSGVRRDEIFITTKVWNDDQGYATTLQAIDASLERLRMDYVDLYLIHWPLTDEHEGENRRAETWRAMEEIRKAGKAKSIGVSNYEVRHLKEMEKYAQTPPAVNQIEMHPLDFPQDINTYCHEKGILVTDYAPLGRAHHFKDPTLSAIAKKKGKTVPQIMLRWGLQHGNIVIPKSARHEHIKENFEIFDFELDEDDMRRIDDLDQDESVV